MKTKWMIIPVMIIALGCSRELETHTSYFEGEFTLYASSGEQETKTVLQQDGSISWSPSDCINVFYGNKSGKFTSTNTEVAAFAEFTGSLGAFTLDGSTEFVAIYPYSDSNSISGTTLSVTLPEEQTAVEGSFADDLFICVAKSKDYNLHFYNVCGGVKFSLARDGIKKVVFKGKNGAHLAGLLTVNFASDGIPQVSRISNGKSAISLVAPNGGTFKKGSWYYLVVAPQLLSQGYRMELYTDELVETLSSDSPVTIRRSAWGVLKNLAAGISVENVTLDKTELSLLVGEKATLVATVMPENATDKSVIWSSSDESVATVSSDGVVIGINAGSAVITATTVDGGKKAACAVTVKAENSHEWVDLGLPSGLLWATCNVGSSSPEDFGDSFAWGETEPKNGFSWYNYKWCSGSYTSMTKYNNDSFFGIVDNKTRLELEDDAARANWKGNWRMPTINEFSELKNPDNCEWTWTTRGTTGGYQVTSKKNGNSIFLPARKINVGGTGYYYEGVYWSASLYTGEANKARELYFLSYECHDDYISYRYNGNWVRPVSDEAAIHVQEIILDRTELVLLKGENWTLRATVLPENAVNKGVRWSSSNGSIATVSSSGVVSGIALGTATITATTYDGGKTATCLVTVTDNQSSGHEWVDLGLPSGTKWATCNVGASRPEESGYYFAWAETEPKTEYSWTTYKWYDLSTYTYTKYSIYSEMDLDDDAARINWGGGWKTPAPWDFEELVNYCSWEWTTLGGVDGYWITSKSNGNSIFLPVAGYWGYSGFNDSYGLYWNSYTSSESNEAYCLYFVSRAIYKYDTTLRWNGCPVRAILQ